MCMWWKGWVVLHPSFLCSSSLNKTSTASLQMSDSLSFSTCCVSPSVLSPPSLLLRLRSPSSPPRLAFPLVALFVLTLLPVVSRQRLFSPLSSLTHRSLFVSCTCLLYLKPVSSAASESESVLCVARSFFTVLLSFFFYLFPVLL